MQLSQNTIFLDIDGVLNRQSDWKKKFTLHTPCLDALKALAERIHCQRIVISSTWRANAGENEPEFYRHLVGELTARGFTVVGTTPLSTHTREEEIAYYTRRHDCGKFLVLDDDDSLFPQKNLPVHFVSHITGLTDSDVAEAAKMWKKYWQETM